VQPELADWKSGFVASGRDAVAMPVITTQAQFTRLVDNVCMYESIYNAPLLQPKQSQQYYLNGVKLIK